MEILLIFYAFLIGAVFGSFANVVIYRLPLEKSVIKPPSACVSCGNRLGFRDLIPIISWVVQKGRCRFCNSGVSGRYPFVEFLGGILFVLMLLYTHYNSLALFLLFPLCIFATTLLIISFIDWDTQEIPDGLVIIGVVAGLIWVAFGSMGWLNALFGVLAGGLPLFILDKLVILLIKKDGFGYGDVKLMAMAGLFLGWQLTFVAFFFAFISGGIYATYLLATGKAERGEYMAFGPFLCVGVLVAFWAGEAVLRALFLL